MSSMFTDAQYNNITRGYHPDCCDAEVCSVCDASEANLKACGGNPPSMCLELWRAAIRHDHNADPERVLHTSHINDSKLLDAAARRIFDLEQSA